jgi:hypothetical protein
VGEAAQVILLEEHAANSRTPTKGRFFDTVVHLV